MPFDFKKWINPKLKNELLTDLDESIDKIAKLIDKETLNVSKEKISKMSFDDDEKELENFIEEYLDKIIENIPKE